MRLRLERVRAMPWSSTTAPGRVGAGDGGRATAAVSPAGVVVSVFMVAYDARGGLSFPATGAGATARRRGRVRGRLRRSRLRWKAAAD